MESYLGLDGSLTGSLFRALSGSGGAGWEDLDRVKVENVEKARGVCP